MALWFKFNAKLVRVLDGDTVELDLDLGFHLTLRHIVRVWGIDCPELEGATAAAGEAAKAFTVAWFAACTGPLLVHTFKPNPEDKYGRYLATIMRDEADPGLGCALQAAGMAVPYSGGKKPPPVGP